MTSLGKKRPCATDSEESKSKKRNLLISPELQKELGPILGNKIFLKLFQKHYFPEKTINECAQYIVDSSKYQNRSYIQHILSYIQAELFPEVKTGNFLLNIFEKVMKIYTLYMFQTNPSNTILCIFDGKQLDVKLVRASIKNGETCFLSEMFELHLVNDGNTVQYVATLRKDIRLHEVELGKISFVPSDDVSNPPVVLGKGSYGLVFKIIGVDGVWYIVKVFYVKEFAEHEWSALKIVMGKHPSLQQGIALQTEREGDIQHIIVSCYQGDIVLSKVRDSIYLLNLQQIIWMFLELSKGLMKLHELGILHCDLKPDNLILSHDSEGRLILNLIDFGIAEKIGKETHDPQSHYTCWYRDPSLFLDYFMRSFNTKMSTFIKPVELSRVMDWRAFFITFLHSVSDKSNDFLGFGSKTEKEARKHMILTSCVPQLILKMKPFLGGDNRNIEFVRQIYFVLLNKEGPEKFVEIFNSVGLKLTGTGTHDEYLKMFNQLRDHHPMIAHVRNVFKHIRSDNKELDISGPMNKLTVLFVEILRDGADLSLLGCLTMDHIQQWLNRLKESLLELCRLGSKIFFY
jgi:serine/threonine protein kinase